MPSAPYLVGRFERQPIAQLPGSDSGRDGLVRDLCYGKARPYDVRR
jgi:hypothetical protein